MMERVAALARKLFAALAREAALQGEFHAQVESSQLVKICGPRGRTPTRNLGGDLKTLFMLLERLPGSTACNLAHN